MTEAKTADHWWWRPGWSVGRRFYTWHLTFDGQHDLHRIAAAWRARLAPFPMLDLVPDQWLHLTMQGIGFVDEVEPATIDAIVAATRPHLAKVPGFELVLDRPSFTPEAIRWDPESTGPAQVRDAIRAGIADVRPEVPEPADGFGAHVTIGYANSDSPAGPILDVLANAPSDPATVRIRAAQLIELNRDNRMYEWTTVAEVPLAD
jgi:2'-5' RNA ligase